MKISDLESCLASYRQEHGDLEIELCCNDYDGEDCSLNCYEIPLDSFQILNKIMRIAHV
jgi:hypothetical protein